LVFSGALIHLDVEEDDEAAIGTHPAGVAFLVSVVISVAVSIIVLGQGGASSKAQQDQRRQNREDVFHEPSMVIYVIKFIL